jgi:adenylylsulfate kinase-like enzyme
LFQGSKDGYVTQILDGQGVLHGVLQTLHYDHIDMHKLTLKIQEVIAFIKWITDKIELW